MKEVYVKELLKFIYLLIERRYSKAEYRASIIMLDFYDAIKRAKLTERQRQVIMLLYFIDMSRLDASVHLGITRQGVEKIENTAIRRIAEHIEI